MDDRAATNSDRLECFDAVRGLAALAVVVGHLILTFWPAVAFRTGPGWELVPAWLQLLVRFPGKFLWDGHAAVSIFFVLSGFVLSVAFLRTGSRTSLSSAAIRRYPRLMLPVCASVLLAYALLKCGAMCNQAAVAHMKVHSGHSHSWLGVYYDFSPDFFAALAEGICGAFVGTARYNLVLWTMPIELAGSFLVFSSIALFGSLRHRFLLYAAGGAILFSCDQFYFLDFILGIAICDFWLWNERTWRGRLPVQVGLALLCIAIFLTPWKPLAAALVVGVTAFCPAVQRSLRAPWLAFLGRISFAVYLIHMPLICSLGCGVYLGLCTLLAWSHTPAAAVAASIALAGSIVLAWGFYHAVDRPSMAVARALDMRIFRPQEAGAKASTGLDPVEKRREA